MCVIYYACSALWAQGWRFRNVHYYYYLRKISLFTFYTNFLCAIHNLPLRLHNLFPLHVLNNLSLRITQSLPTFTLSFSTFYTAFLYVLRNLSLRFIQPVSTCYTIFLYFTHPFLVLQSFSTCYNPFSTFYIIFLYVIHNSSLRFTQPFSRCFPKQIKGDTDSSRGTLLQIRMEQQIRLRGNQVIL